MPPTLCHYYAERMVDPPTYLLEANVYFLVKEPPRVIPWQWECKLLAYYHLSRSYKGKEENSSGISRQCIGCWKIETNPIMVGCSPNSWSILWIFSKCDQTFGCLCRKTSSSKREHCSKTVESTSPLKEDDCLERLLAFVTSLIAESVTWLTRRLLRLAEFAKFQAHAAYAAYTRGLSSEWTFLTRVSPGIADHIGPTGKRSSGSTDPLPNR